MNTDFSRAKDEFPTWKAPEGAFIPTGFADTSWHNNMCPSFTDPTERIWFWMNFEDPADREIPEGKRFTVSLYDADGNHERDAIDTDDFNEAAAVAAAELKKLEAA